MDMRHRIHSKSPSRRYRAAAATWADSANRSVHDDFGYNDDDPVIHTSISCKKCLLTTCMVLATASACFAFFVALALNEYDRSIRRRRARRKRAYGPRRPRYNHTNCTANDTDRNEKQYTGLAFIHVPKCGGTSMRDLLSGLAESCGYHSFTLETPHWVDLTESSRSRIEVYGGSNHLVHYDLVRSWPGNHINTAAFFTQLRHPWDRLASHYHYVRGLGNEHVLGNETARQNFSDWSVNAMDGYLLSFFAPRNVTEIDNHELRRCCYDRSDLEAAKTLLHEKFTVGLIEAPQMTADVLRCRVSWIRKAMEANPITLGKIPHSNKRTAEYNVSTVDEEAVRKQFPLDLEFYDFGRDLLYKQHADCVKKGLILDNII